MTGALASYLKTLCEEAGEEFQEALTKAEASKRIEELQAKTGRVPDHCALRRNERRQFADEGALMACI